MGKLALKKYATTMILVVQIIIAIFTFVGIFGGADSPIGNTAKAMMVYALPFLIVANIVLLIYWLISRNWLWALITLLHTLHRHFLPDRIAKRPQQDRQD